MVPPAVRPDPASLAAWLPEHDVKWALSQALSRTFPSGASIYTPSRPPTGMYLLRSGSVKICLDFPHGEEHVFAWAGQNWFVGDPAPLFGHRPAAVSAVCLTRCEAAFWPYSLFETMLRDRPPLAAALVYQSVLTYHLAVQRFEVLMWPSSRLRVLHALVLLVQVFGEWDPVAGCRIPLPLTQTGLGIIANVSRVTVNRVLADLRRQGIVTRCRPLSIHHPDRLDALFQEEIAALAARGRTRRAPGV